METNLEMNDSVKQDITGLNMTKFEWCPGNGTRYEILVSKLNGRVSCGCLGEVVNGWLVVCGLTKVAYMFQPVGDLHPDYIREKFNLVYEGDIKYITKLVSFAINRPCI